MLAVRIPVTFVWFYLPDNPQSKKWLLTSELRKWHNSVIVKKESQIIGFIILVLIQMSTLTENIHCLISEKICRTDVRLRCVIEKWEEQIIWELVFMLSGVRKVENSSVMSGLSSCGLRVFNKFCPLFNRPCCRNFENIPGYQGNPGNQD